MAPAFKQCFPKGFQVYRESHKRGELALGRILVFEQSQHPGYILYFLTNDQYCIPRIWVLSSRTCRICGVFCSI